MYPLQSSTRAQSDNLNQNSDQASYLDDAIAESSVSSISPILPVSESNHDTLTEADSIPSPYRSVKNCVSQKVPSKAQINFNSFHSQLPNEWDFEEDAEDFVIYDP